MTNLFPRRALQELEAWRKADDRKPLVIRGARQVGKSCLVRLFARSYRRYAELNLEKPAHAALFRRGLSLGELIQAIQLECRVAEGPEPLLIFLDEIQEVPEAVAMLRFFHEERPEIHVIAAGSLLEVSVESAELPFPVGRVQFLYLRPFSFREFLQALGENEAGKALDAVPVPAYAHDRLLALFHNYCLVGGMPEAVRQYVVTRADWAVLNRVYADLFSAYRDDILKYGRNETIRRVLLHCLDSAPFLAGARVRFHGFGGSNYRSREVGEALRTLERAMLLELVYPTVQVAEPFMPDRRKSPRLHFLDIGLVNHRAGLQGQLIGIRDLTDVYRGRLVEQVVGQELKAMDVRMEVPLLFWVREKPQSHAEVDFLVRTEHGTVPVEVKSGPAGKLRSLHQFMMRTGGRLAVRLHAGPWSREVVNAGGVSYVLLNVPYYAAGLIPEYVRLGSSSAAGGAGGI